MAQIKNENQYKAIMARVEELLFETDENTPADDARLQELDLLSALVEEYENEHYPIGITSHTHLKQKNLTPIEDLISEDFGAIGSPQRDQFETECDDFIIGEQLKEEPHPRRPVEPSRK